MSEVLDEEEFEKEFKKLFPSRAKVIFYGVMIGLAGVVTIAASLIGAAYLFGS